MKNPNRFGSITKLKGNRRRPYVIREGQSGKQKVIGYASTRAEAIEILSEFNKNPFRVDLKNATFAKVFEMFAETYTKSNLKSLKSTFNRHCQELHSIPISEIKPYMYQRIYNDAPPSLKATVLNVFKKVDKTAMMYSLIAKPSSQFVETAVYHNANARDVYSLDEIRLIMSLTGKEHTADVLAVLLHSGMRISELLELTTESYHEFYFIGGKKTAAGINRIIPIHPDVKNIILRWLDSSRDGRIVSYSYASEYAALKEFNAKYNIEHIFHETRHTFRTQIEKCGAKISDIDKIMGHVSSTGNDVYNHRTADELYSAILHLDFYQ